MARIEIDEVIFTSDGGRPVFAANAQVYVYTRGTTTQIPVYTAETGTSTRTQPLTTNAYGEVDGWVEESELPGDLAAYRSGVLIRTQPWGYSAGDAWMLEELVAGPTRFDTADALPVVAFVAPFIANVTQASIVSLATAVTASDTNYWTVALKRWRANVATTIATKTTKVTGGEAVAALTDWNFDAATWTTSAASLVKGDQVGVTFTGTGSPTAFKGALQVRYEPNP